MEYRVLIVDDDNKQSALVAELIQGNKVLANPDSIFCETCASFQEALAYLTQKRFDLVILDLKDDGAQTSSDTTDTKLAGETLYEDVKKARFIPIIFYSGYAEKIKEHERPFVRMVTKGDVKELRAEVQKIFDTKLPSLMRHLDEELRVYMWESVESLWSNETPTDSNDIVYLIARRLASLLQGDVLREFFRSQGTPIPEGKNIHPVEMYVWPPISINSYFFGDILFNDQDAKYYVVLTPSCDLQQKKADFVILGSCKLLSECKESKKIREAKIGKQEISNGAKTELTDLVKGNTNPKDRLKYMPGTNFLPDLVLDLQCLLNIEYAQLITEKPTYKKIASFDTPFAEALQSQFTRYYGRIGTPDLAVDIAYERAIKNFP